MSSFTQSTTIELAKLWRQQQNRIVFVNGCFDVLHSGHLHLLKKAKDSGNRLIIAVNDDYYCRRHKGPSRPIQPAEIRAHVAGSVVNADAVCIFADDTPAKLLEAIRPDVYLLGDDHAGSLPVAADCCGVVWFVSRLPGLSTTNSVQNR